MAMEDVCEICGGDCAAANPPVIDCPKMVEADTRRLASSRPAPHADPLAVPCPFCGGKRASTQLDETTGGKWGFVGCGCGARGPDVRTGYDSSPQAQWRADAVSEWNLSLTIPREGLI